jgi:LCP family protein required for cell wall assembly
MTAPAGVAPPLRRSWAQRGIIFMNLVLIAAALSAALLLNYGYGRAAAINRVALGRSLTPVPEDLQPGERVINILLVGSDSSANLDEDDPIQIGRQGERFGDVIIVAHIDERSSEIALLSFPRDLWVEVAGTGRPSRINKAFESGGPATLIETIENEFDIPIHHYVNVDFAGFQGLVAAIDSVEVYFETPARDWNVNAKPVPRSQTGFLVEEAGCQSLDPEMALAYVRSRYFQTQDANGRWVTDPTSDLGRIRRQQDFLRRVLQKAIQKGARNPFVLRDLIDTGLENVAIDQKLTPQLLVDLGMTYRSFDPDLLQTYSFPSTDGWVGRNQVLLPSVTAAEPVLELFRGAGFSDPSTVGLTVRIDPDADPDTQSRLVTLERSGYELQQSARPVYGPGVIVRHGPDGGHAAELVATAFTSAGGSGAGDDPAAGVVVEQVDGLVGRSVVLSIGPEPALAGDQFAVAGAGQDQDSGRAIERNPTATASPDTTPVPGREESVSEIDPIDDFPAQEVGTSEGGVPATCG